ncbi:gamma-glutamyltransferase family protein [Castellaniella sp.]|uniref:gamma-glutamyltransferase family protein n=1 Tax=Castellaniella sp. TaxID=1955812 RepID=UPI003A934348
MRNNPANTQAMVATGNPLAASVATEILREGGSAVDAAIAADAVMGLVEPMATSIGGDLLAMVHQPGQPVVSYNGTGRAPAALDIAMVQALPDSKIPERHPLSVTTPGAVQGWWDLHQRFGHLAWARLFDRAIQLAQDGFQVARVAAHEWEIFDFVLHRDPECERLFRSGHPPSAGETLTNPALAVTLGHIAHEGPDYFYRGPLASQVAQAVQRMGGVLAAEDLARHTGNYTQPLSLEFHGARIHQCPPNTHGVAILDALAAVQGHGGAPDDPDTWVHMVGATARAMQAAKKTVADPSGNTVCTVVVDAEGLAVTLMSSVFKRFGSGIVVPEGGFCMQNRGFGFSTPGHINGPAPGKRPYHTVVPGLTTRDGQFLLGMGVVGGLMQPQGQIQILTRVLAWGWDIQEALDAPRWRLEAGDTLAIEKGFPDALAHALRAAGYEEPHPQVGELAGRSDFGGAHAVLRAADGQLHGGADPRKDGQWLRCQF